VDIFALAIWAYQNRAELEALGAKSKPILDLVKAEAVIPIAQRLFASLPTEPKATYTVTDVQRALNKAGVSVAVDGTYGQETRAAVERFQQLHALTVDGWVGPETMAVLEAYGLG
jgi:murein L,D-transpeptidase YcbB/YkuD